MFENGSLQVLNMTDILPNRFQPRIHFDEIKLLELADSIRKFGVIQPIVVRQINNKYEIIAGERRFKASEIANKTTIPAIVVTLSDKDAEEIALLENVQRQELTAIEEAVSYKRILDMGYISQEELANKIGKPQSVIVNKIRLLNLDDQVQDALLHGKISERHARSLLRIPSRSGQAYMVQRIISERLTVKRTDDEIKKFLADNPSGQKVINNSMPTEKVEPKVNAIDQAFIESLFKDDVKKKPTVSDNTNVNERGNKNMDIDKIMKEAQDINAPKQANDISGLMRQDGMAFGNNDNVTPAPSTNTVSTTTQPQDENKFINFSSLQQEEPKTTNVNTNTGGVSFDSIFNQEPVNVSPAPSAPAPTPSPVPTPVTPSTPTPAATTVPNVPNTPVQSGPTPQPVPNTTVSPVGSAPVTPSPAPAPASTSSGPAYHTIGSDKAIEPGPVSEPINTSPVAPKPASSFGDDSLAEYQKPINNIPTPDVIETPNAGLNQPVTPVTPVAPAPQPASVSPIPAAQTPAPAAPAPDAEAAKFRQVISLLRSCSTQIEKLGYFVDVDELDLGDTYQVTFKIDKE